MADKKPAPKSAPKKSSAAPSAGSGHLFELEVKIFSVIAFIVLMYFATGKYVLQSMGYGPETATSYAYMMMTRGLDLFNSLFNLVVFISVFLILLFVLGAIYLNYKHKEILALHKMSLPKGYVAGTSGSSPASSAIKNDVSSDNTMSVKPVLNTSGENKKWDDVQNHMQSMNSSDWRMAILEADILLYEMLDQMGYAGDTVADKLKLIESSDFNTLYLAWRAHKVRNTIAHEGASYELSHQQAQNTIDLYRKVFEEFYFI